ncbi:hypothetical protein F5B20DRAFT_588382 [Whalleya microplaca]|nr:hypothetical protein F5B20DRAFT_588382 [Whalleya microplaca]
MPYHRADAPASIPDHEIIESLLGRSNNHDYRTRRIKRLNQLSKEEQERTGLITLGKRKTHIPGDPYGVYPSWAGNIGHPRDIAMFSVLRPIFKQLLERKQNQTDQINAIEKLLRDVSRIGPETLVAELADEGKVTTMCDNSNELAIRFSVRGKSVRILQAKDVDKDDRNSFKRSNRARAAAEKTEELIGEGEMPISVQQYLMASIRHESPQLIPNSKAGKKRYFLQLRADARDRYWMQMNKEQRIECRHLAKQDDKALTEHLRVIREYWPGSWRNTLRDTDYFRNYVCDQVAAEQVWELIEDDILIIIDRHRRVIFASIEKFTQLLFGQEIMELLIRSLDLWSFYCPLPAPETQRHTLDKHVRRLHPELDMSQVTVDNLPNAKMVVMHYGCWTEQGKRNGQELHRSDDSIFGRSRDQKNVCALYPEFLEAVLGTTTSLLGFLMRNLDPNHYQDCRDIIENLPEYYRMRTDEEDFISLFVLGVNGYTQRHSDTNDIAGGMAGLVTLGDYKGGNLCLPQFGLKVPYVPGTCAVIAGDVLDHLVTDYSGTRFFLIGTNHESTKRYIWRNIGRSTPLPNVEIQLTEEHGDSGTSDKASGHVEQEYESHSDSSEDWDAPCVNKGDDDHDDTIEWTNTMVHGSGALHSSSDSSPDY